MAGISPPLGGPLRQPAGRSLFRDNGIVPNFLPVVRGEIWRVTGPRFVDNFGRCRIVGDDIRGLSFPARRKRGLAFIPDIATLSKKIEWG